MLRIAFFAGVSALTLAACDDPRAPNEAHFTAGMRAYLARRGDLCVGKPVWPIDVSRDETRGGSRDAVQMPVLERLGLVKGTDAVADVDTEDGPVKVEVRRYTLTPEGTRYYLPRDARPGQTPAHDFCAAKLTLDKVVGWADPSSKVVGSHTTVEYTYRAEGAAWTRDPEALRVFPMVARVLNGAGADRLKEGFTLTDKGWVADELLDEAPAPVAKSEARTP
ncbi:MAG TPA: hypothetical protein VHC69_18760 [Polyangiaceae bacterium]|nr:hypothetical protein [Polyangiaceae bacterium]